MIFKLRPEKKLVFAPLEAVSQKLLISLSLHFSSFWDILRSLRIGRQKIFSWDVTSSGLIPLPTWIFFETFIVSISDTILFVVKIFYLSNYLPAPPLQIPPTFFGALPQTRFHPTSISDSLIPLKPKFHLFYTIWEKCWLFSTISKKIKLLRTILKVRSSDQHPIWPKLYFVDTKMLF